MEEDQYVVTMNYQFFIDASSHEEAARRGLEQFIERTRASQKIETTARRNGTGSIDEKSFAFQVEETGRALAEKLKTALGETNKLLEDIQWFGRDENGYICCPDCGAMAPNGYHKGESHNKDCDIIKALERNTALL